MGSGLFSHSISPALARAGKVHTQAHTAFKKAADTFTWNYSVSSEHLHASLSPSQNRRDNTDLGEEGLGGCVATIGSMYRTRAGPVGLQVCGVSHWLSPEEEGILGDFWSPTRSLFPRIPTFP